MSLHVEVTGWILCSSYLFPFACGSVQGGWDGRNM